MGVKYEVKAVTGTYKDNNGNEKQRTVKVGVIIEGRNGFMMKLEAIPVGWDGWAYLNAPEARSSGGNRPQRAAPPPPADDGFDDSDIAF